jgi:uncharacterized protein YqjF (DUF2071 family)
MNQTLRTESPSPATMISVAPRKRVFLNARWHALAMVNFAIDPGLLEPLVPQGTTLDFFGGVAYLSVVGFLFRDTRLLGVPVPGHIHFEEVNLRFYVQRTVGHEVRRGVCFVKELVPRWAIATVARWGYNEPYQSLPMRHDVDLNRLLTPAAAPTTHWLSYEWHAAGEWQGFHIQTTGPCQQIEAGSLEEFIAEHYWGYCRQRDGGTVEYEVEHPPWHIWSAKHTTWLGDVPGFYGEPWASALRGQASSAFVADGSAVKVYRPTKIA